MSSIHSTDGSVSSDSSWVILAAVCSSWVCTSIQDSDIAVKAIRCRPASSLYLIREGYMLKAALEILLDLK